jgi:short-subunit dehydrogenase
VTKLKPSEVRKRAALAIHLAPSCALSDGGHDLRGWPLPLYLIFVVRKNGLLINIASAVALAPQLLNGTYSGTKAYVVNFTQALKNGVEGKGVTVQAVLPAPTATPFWDKAGVPVQHLPNEMVITSEDMVDASLESNEEQPRITTK